MSRPLDRYAGVYRDSLYGEVRVAFEDGKLMLRYGPAMVGALEHWHYDTFRAEWTDKTMEKELVTFHLDKKGEPESIQFLGITARRVPAPASEPVLARKPEELARFVGVYRREAPPLEVTVELLHGKLKMTTFGEPVSSLAPIEPARFRVEGAAAPKYLQFKVVNGKIEELVIERYQQPKVILAPKASK
jgi:hypothetical protein